MSHNYIYVYQWVSTGLMEGKSFIAYPSSGCFRYNWSRTRMNKTELLEDYISPLLLSVPPCGS